MVTEKNAGNEFKQIPVSNLILDEELNPRFVLSEEAIERYREMFREDRTPPALKVQASENGTHKVIDGFHRVKAALMEKVARLPCEILDVKDDDLLALAYRFNRENAVPITSLERDATVIRLATRFAKTQREIAELVGFKSPSSVNDILRRSGVEQTKTRTKLTDEERVAVVQLLLKGEKGKDLAERFHVSDALVSKVKSEFRDQSMDLYTSGKMKQEVSDALGLEANEVDTLLREAWEKSEDHKEPLNFTPQESTVWPSFGIDSRFGKKHPGNIPVELVKNILCRLTKPGDLILDPFAGGGVTIDACADFVDRSCEAFDLTPVREDIKPWDILKGPPPVSRPPDLIFLDPPYGPQKAGEYSKRDNDLANMSVEQFLKSMEKVFGYWNHGWLVCLMTVYTRDGLGKYVHLPAKIAEAMERTGWAFHERIVNQIGRAEGTNALSVSRLQKANEGRGWWSRRDDLDILIGRKK
jgi:ParB-like chromosome segregation protein Spo0J